MNNLPAEIMTCMHNYVSKRMTPFYTVMRWGETEADCGLSNSKPIVVSRKLKTHTMFLGGRRDNVSLSTHTLSMMGDQPLRNEQTAKYLDVFMDDKLNLKHAAYWVYMAKKAGRNLGILRRVSKHLPIILMKTRRCSSIAIVLPGHFFFSL